MTGDTGQSSLTDVRLQIKDLESMIKLGDRESASKIELATATIQQLAEQLTEQHRNGEAAITAVRRDLTDRMDKFHDRVFGDNEYSLDKRVSILERFRWSLLGAVAAGVSLSGAFGALVGHFVK